DTPDAGIKDRVRARRGPTAMTARFERDIERRALKVRSVGVADRLDLCMRGAERAVKPLADDLVLAPDDRPHDRVRADAAAAPLGQLDRPREVEAIRFAFKGHRSEERRVGK